MVKAASVVGGATMASRVTGFVRDIFIAALLGAGPLAEIFVVAFRLPNLFRRLFAEGAFNAAFVPLFSERVEEKGLAAALAFAGRIASILAAFLSAFTCLSMIFMPGLVLALAQGFALLGVLFAVPPDLGERNLGWLVGFAHPAAGLVYVFAAGPGFWPVSRQ